MIGELFTGMLFVR